MLGMSQKQLGKALGLTSLQLQRNTKMETPGSALARLQQIADVLMCRRSPSSCCKNDRHGSLPHTCYGRPGIWNRNAGQSA
jgi:transcriptional regulator with XRE-family HTH domain